MTDMPCAVSDCRDPASRIAQTTFVYYRNEPGPGPGTRWVAKEEQILLYMCPEHHLMWRQLGSTITKDVDL